MQSDTVIARRGAGFTLVELLVVLCLMSILALLGGPTLFHLIQQEKLLAITQQTATALRLARLEAIKTSGSSIVQIDTAKNTITIFDDANGNLLYDAGEPVVAVYRVEVGKGVSFGAVSGFTADPRGVTYPAMAVFNSSGAVSTAGAFRFANTRGDQIEVRVMLANGGTVKLRKLQGGTYIEQGEGGQQWKWN